MDEWYAALSQRCARGMVPGQVVCDRILQTASDMVRDRGFEVTASVAEMRANLASGQPLAKCAAADGRQCVLWFDREERIGVKTVRTLVEAHQGAHFVFIAIDGATPFTKRETAGDDRVCFFSARELVHNITKHSLVPRHVRLPPDEAAEVTRRFCMLPEHWPVIFTSDPVARWYGWPPGAIIRIHRVGLTQDEHIFYRKVVRAAA